MKSAICSQTRQTLCPWFHWNSKQRNAAWVSILVIVHCSVPVRAYWIYLLHSDINTVPLCSQSEEHFISACRLSEDGAIHTSTLNAVSDTQPVRRMQWAHKRCRTTQEDVVCVIQLCKSMFKRRHSSVITAPSRWKWWMCRTSVKLSTFKTFPDTICSSRQCCLLWWSLCKPECIKGRTHFVCLTALNRIFLTQQFGSCSVYLEVISVQTASELLPCLRCKKRMNEGSLVLKTTQVKENKSLEYIHQSKVRT